VTVLDERQIQALGMGALYGTGQGSTRPPRRRPVRSSRWRAVTPR
jgi:leucyl aminopeptidase